MSTHLLDVLQILGFIPLLFCVTLGWGRYVRGLLGASSSSLISYNDAWVGLVCITLVSEIFHFFSPINWVLGFGIALLGVSFLFSMGLNQIKIELARLRSFIIIHPWACIAILLTFAAWISRSMDSVNNYDTGLYHLQTIQWLNEHQLVKGLANLHSRFGFNQSYFSFLALLNAFPLWTRGYALGNVFLLALALGMLFNAKFITYRCGWWLLLSLSFAISIVAQKIAAPSPDFAIGILQIVIFIKAIECISEKDLIFSENINVLLILCAFIITVKLSSVIYSAIMALTVMWICEIYSRKKISLVLKTLLFCFAIVLIHYFRGYLLSGYPLYPSLFLGLPSLPWSIPVERVILEAKWVYSFAKNPLSTPDLVLGNWNWIQIWIGRQSLSLWRFLGVDCALIVINFLLILKATKGYIDKKWLSLYTPLIASLIFWFLIAPDWRFLGSIPELIIALAGWLCMRATNLPLNFPARVTKFLKKQLIGIVIFLLVIRVIHVATLPINGWQPWPREKLTQKYTESGLPVNLPLVGELCWDAPLPCAAEFNPRLQLVTPENKRSNLDSGFTSKAQ